MKLIRKITLTALLLLVLLVLLLCTSHRSERVWVWNLSASTSVYKQSNPQIDNANDEIVQDKRSPPAAQRKTSLIPVMANTKSGLTPEVIDGIKKFVFFIGYPRSGHSIVGTLMDAHPHVVIANEFYLFKKFPVLNEAPEIYWRENLFMKLFEASANDIIRSRANKGYTLRVEGLWQGRYDDYIEVIGDKSGGRTTDMYVENKKTFLSNYQKLKQKVNIPIRVIHVLRNPFDMISTGIFYDIGGSTLNAILKKKKKPKNEILRLSSDRIVKMSTQIFRQISAVAEMIDRVFGKENVLELHNSDLVADPRGTILKIFNFLEVDTTEHYLDVCAEKVFKSVSRSRDLMVWPPEQREWVEKEMKKYEMLSRYNFTSD